MLSRQILRGSHRAPDDNAELAPIMLVRADGDGAYGYGFNAQTAAARGAALQEAFTALEAGDTLLLGPFTFTSATIFTITPNNVIVIGCGEKSVINCTNVAAISLVLTGTGPTLRNFKLTSGGSGIGYDPTVAPIEMGGVGNTFTTEIWLGNDTGIVGTDAGDLGHADGAVLVSAPGADKALEFVSAVLIYDYDTADYTGMTGDDLAVQNGDADVILSPVIADADLLLASGDKVVQINALSASDQALTANKPLSLKCTAVTDPGTADGVLRCIVTYRRHDLALA